MINFILTNCNATVAGEFANVSSGNSSFFKVELGSWIFLANRSEEREFLWRDKGDFILIVIGNPILLDDFYSIWNYFSIEELYKQPQNILKIFHAINGIVGCICINKPKEEVIVFTDPLGFWPFYYTNIGNVKYFTDSLKYLLFLIPEHLNLNEKAIQCYLENGHFVSGHCWFQNVKKGLPARAYFTSITKEIEEVSYWNWEKVLQCNDNVDVLQNQYIQSFQRQFEGQWLQDKKFGVALSGGLDSRWVTYELNKRQQIETFTFAAENSLDVKIAQEVSNFLKCKWIFIHLKKKNWLKDRLNLFWQADGMVTLDQFHEGEIYQYFKSKFDIISTGFYGGGIYPSFKEADRRISTLLANKWFAFNGIETLVSDPYFNIDKIDPYISTQRIANQGAIHVYNMTKYLKVFIPFYNLKWLEVNYSLKDSVQIYHRFYLKVLQIVLPDNLLSLVWQKTCIPIKYINLNVLFLKLKLYKIIDIICQILGFSYRFVNYNFMESTLDELIIKLKNADLQFLKKPNTLNKKWRYVSILLWLEMAKQKRSDVL